MLKARGPIDVSGCTAAERAALRPTATASLTKLKSGKPVLKVTVRKAKNGVRLTSTSVRLPSNVKGSPKGAKKGLRVVAGGKRVARSGLKVTSKTMSIRLSKTGRSVISLLAQKGAVAPSKKLRTARRLPKVKLRLTVRDTDNRTFTLSVPVKLRR